MWGYIVHLAIRHQLNLGYSHKNCPKSVYNPTCWYNFECKGRWANKHKVFGLGTIHSIENGIIEV